MAIAGSLFAKMYLSGWAAFKPFIYLTAVENGYAPDTVVMDSPVTVDGWRPKRAFS